MNAQGDDDIVPDTVPDQVSGAVENELDGDHLENVKMSYSPCVSRHEQVFFVLVILSREKSQLKLRISVENHFKKSVVQVFLLGKHTPNFPTLAIY